MAERRPWWLAPLVDLVIHVLVGSVLFAVIFAPAVALEFAIEALANRISDTLMLILKVTKVTIAAIDAMLYIVFMVRMGVEFIRDLFRPKHEEHANGSR
jgi:hypothetical protein